MPQPSIIFIDWFQTLSWSKFWDGWKEETHPLHDQFTQAQNWFFKEQKELVTAWMRNEETAETICQRLAERSGIPFDILFQELEASARNMEMIAGSAEEIQRIRSMGIRVLLVTDNMDPFTRWTVPALDLTQTFDGIFSSHQTGLLKSQRDEHGKATVFDQLLNQYEKSWPESLLIDDCADRHADLCELGLNLAAPTSPSETIRILKSIV